jgi:hypothetical protein
MTDQDSNTHNPMPADQPLGLRFSGLGPLVEYADKLRTLLFGLRDGCGVV